MQEATRFPTSASDLETDEIDLRQYLDVVMEWWREVFLVLFSVLFVALVSVLLIRLLTPDRYTATALVAIVRTTSAVTFDERFTTEADNQLNANAAQATARRSALLGLAGSPMLAATVIPQLDDILTEEERQPARLVRSIQAHLGANENDRPESDLIAIKATAADPDKAAALATTWANAYVTLVNSVYGQVADALIDSIEQEQVRAQAEYDSFQGDLEAFVAQDQSVFLTRQITQTEELIGELQRSTTATIAGYVDQGVAARQSLMRSYLDQRVADATLVYEKEQSRWRGLVGVYLDSIVQGERAVFSEQVQLKLEQFGTTYDRLASVRRHIDDAQALRNQLAALDAQEVIGGALTLQVLHLQSFADQGALQLQLDIAKPVPRPALLAEVDALISSLTQQARELDEQVQVLNQELLGGDTYELLGATADTDSPLAQAAEQLQARMLAEPDSISATVAAVFSTTVQASMLPFVDTLESDVIARAENPVLQGAIAELEAELRQLRAQLETQNARSIQLVQRRDLAREALRSINSKVTELTLARAAGSSEVRLAAGAVAPAQPDAKVSLTTVLALAGVLALLLAVMGVFLLHYLGQKPFLQRWAAPRGVTVA